MTCAQELCLNWTGMGCACQVYDLEPNIVETALRTLTAAAVPVGAVVHLDDTDVEITHVRNGAPLPGWLILTDTTGREWHLGGAERVGVVSLP